MRGYFDWFMSAPHADTVAFHKMFLQHLQWGREGRHWMCKAVEHGVLLQELAQGDVSGCPVRRTHRDPYAQIGSLASTLAVIRERCGGLNDPAQLGRDAVRCVKETVDKGMLVRQASPPEMFHDVYFPDLVRDPIGSLGFLYEAGDGP